MTFTDRVVTITRESIIPKVFDNFLNLNVITYRFIGTGQKFTSYAAKPIVKLAKNTQGGSFSGMAVLDIGVVETRKKMTFEPKAYSKPCAIPGLEQSVNETESQVLSLLSTEMDSTIMDALDDVAELLYGNGLNEDFDGFGNLDDNGTVSDTVGSLSRTTYTSLKGTTTSFAGVLSLAKEATMFSAISAGSLTRQRPTLLISSEAELDYYEQLLTPMQRSNFESFGGYKVTRTSRGPVKQSEITGVAGITSYIFKGVPWVADEKAPSGKVWHVNEEYLYWLGLKGKGLTTVNLGDTHDGVYADAPSSNTGLQYRDFMDSFNQYGQVAHLFLLGNMITTQPRRLGVATNVNGV